MADDNQTLSPYFEEQESEIESLKYIFLEDLEVLEEKPYKFEVMLNANNESAEKNWLKLKLTFELPDDYPTQIPIVRIKNLTPDIIHNNKMLEFDRLVATKADENIGNAMIYEICEAVREILSNMNDLVLKKLYELENKDSIEHALAQAFSVSQDAAMTYTPVNAETFGKWCDEYKERMRKIKEESKSENASKLTGRLMFQNTKNYIDEIKIDDEDEEFKGDDDDEDYPEDDENYDKALYEHEDLEDVDFE